MHFCVSAARVSRPGTAPGHLLTSGLCWPRKMGTNWFMPALVNSRFGASGSRLDEGTMVCRFDLKKSRNDWRISRLVIVANQNREGRRSAVPENRSATCQPFWHRRSQTAVAIPKSDREIIREEQHKASGTLPWRQDDPRIQGPKRSSEDKEAGIVAAVSRASPNR